MRSRSVGASLDGYLAAAQLVGEDPDLLAVGGLLDPDGFAADGGDVGREARNVLALDVDGLAPVEPAAFVQQLAVLDFGFDQRRRWWRLLLLLGWLG